MKDKKQIIKTIKCLSCGKIVPARNSINSLYTKKYCSNRCRAKYVAKETYNKLRNNPEYKKKKYKYFKEVWLPANRKRFNDLLREPNRIRSAIRRKGWSEKGLCTGCGKERDGKFNQCSKCRENHRAYQRKSKNKKGFVGVVVLIIILLVLAALTYFLFAFFDKSCLLKCVKWNPIKP